MQKKSSQNGVLFVQQMAALRPTEMHRAKKHRKWKVPKRKYGGNLSHAVVKERYLMTFCLSLNPLPSIVRAFLLEERKIVRSVSKGLSKSFGFNFGILLQVLKMQRVKTKSSGK